MRILEVTDDSEAVGRLTKNDTDDDVVDDIDVDKACTCNGKLAVMRIGMRDVKDAIVIIVTTIMMYVCGMIDNNLDFLMAFRDDIDLLIGCYCVLF